MNPFETNPLEMRGPQFLGLFVALVVIATVMALVLRWLLRGPSSFPLGRTPALDEYEVAYLAGGPDNAVDAAVASLIQRQVLLINLARRALSVRTAVPPDAPPVERAVFNAVVDHHSLPIDSLRRLVRPLVDSLRDRLESAGLVLSSDQQVIARFVPLIGLVGVLGLGMMKILVGISRGRPVSILMLLCLATVFLIGLLAAWKPLRSRFGDRYLAGLRQDNAALQVSAYRSSRNLDPLDLAMAVGLFGPVALVGSSHDALQTLLIPQKSRRKDDSYSTSSSCSAGSSCSSSSCGGGGCGGGGCGGCGS